MTINNNQMDWLYGLFSGQLNMGAGDKANTPLQTPAKETKAIFENAEVIVSMSNVGDLQKVLQEVMMSVKEKRLDISHLQISDALAALAADAESKGLQQAVALNILAIATKTIENTIKNMTMTREEREDLLRKKEKAQTDAEKKELDGEIAEKDKELEELQGTLDEAKKDASEAIGTLNGMVSGGAAVILRGVVRTIAAKAYVMAAQDRMIDREEIDGQIDVSRRILDAFLGIEQDQGLKLGLAEEREIIKSAWKELDARLMERDLSV